MPILKIESDYTSQVSAIVAILSIVNKSVSMFGLVILIVHNCILFMVDHKCL